MFYIVPIIIYKTIENSSASRGKFITLQILVKKKLFHGSARSLQKINIKDVAWFYFETNA